MVMQYQSLRNRTEKENKMEKITPPFTIIHFIQSKLSYALDTLSVGFDTPMATAF